MILLQLLAAVYAFVLPGALVAHLVAPHWSRPVQLTVGTAVGLLTVPLACFCAAWLLGTSVHWPLVLGVATVFNLAAGVPWWMLRRGVQPVPDEGEPPESAP
jgi:hypothetical protein